MTLKQHLHRQIEAALGPENRWYCAEFYGREITDPDALLEYFIKHGGAEGFGQPRNPSNKPSPSTHALSR